MGNLSSRLAALEAIGPLCRACDERRRRIYFAGEPAPDRCEGCGRSIETRTFTLDIGAASGRGDDDAWSA